MSDPVTWFDILHEDLRIYIADKYYSLIWRECNMDHEELSTAIQVITNNTHVWYGMAADLDYYIKMGGTLITDFSEFTCHKKKCELKKLDEYNEIVKLPKAWYLRSFLINYNY